MSVQVSNTRQLDHFVQQLTGRNAQETTNYFAKKTWRCAKRQYEYVVNVYVNMSEIFDISSARKFQYKTPLCHIETNPKKNNIVTKCFLLFNSLRPSDAYMRR